MASIQKMLGEELEKIKPSEDELEEINLKIKEVISAIQKKIKSKRIKAEVFVGGSSAKNTLIKKKHYDIDIFVRFDFSYSEKELKKFLGGIVDRKAKRIHGSRDYFSYSYNGLDFEIIPVFKIKSALEVKNVTDLSYFHVKYVKDKILKNKKLSDEIRLAKAFAYYQKCYGAESYINGFSGYAMELLIIHYKSFLGFLKAITKVKRNEKLFIDLEKKYKNIQEAMERMNNSKLYGPLIVVDPTFMERNALAALSYETFEIFKSKCLLFLKNPSTKFFEEEDKEAELEKKYSSILHKVEIRTSRQEGDIAGTKLKKFYRYFLGELSKFFDIVDTDFEYDASKTAMMNFALTPKKQIVRFGPPIAMKKEAELFRKANKGQKILVKNKRLYFAKKNNLTFEDFLLDFKKNKEKQKLMKQMDVCYIG